MSPDISQEKMSNLTAGLEFVCIYLDDLLTISNSALKDHLYQLQVVLQRLRRVGLKVNVEKLSFLHLRLSTEVICSSRMVENNYRRRYKLY